MKFSIQMWEIFLYVNGANQKHKQNKKTKHFLKICLEEKETKDRKDKNIETNTQYVQNVLISSLSNMQSS